MEIKVESNSIAEVEAGAIIVNLFEGVAQPGGATGAVDKALDGAITALIADGEIKGKLAETTVIHTLGRMPAARVVVVGLGKSKDLDLDRVRRVSGTVCTRLRRIGVKDAATIVHGAGIGGLDPSSAAQALAEGALLGLYRFDKYKSGGDDKSDLDTLRVVEFDAAKVPDIEAGVETGAMLAGAVNRCRDMVNEPANAMTPSQMAEGALEVALASGLEMEVLDRSDMEELGMGALLGVAQGSDVPPKLIVMRYKGDPGDESNVLGLLGKGITFDSGGLDLKPSAGMRQMKRDMSGGAAVISAMGAIAKLGPKINVTGIVAATENMPGANAQKPGDVVSTMNWQDHRDRQHRRRGSTRARRRHGVRAVARHRPHRGHGHAHRRDPHGPRQGADGRVRQRPGTGRPRPGLSRTGGRASLAVPDGRRVQAAVQERRGGHQEHRRAGRRLDHRGADHR